MISFAGALQSQKGGERETRAEISVMELDPCSGVFLSGRIRILRNHPALGLLSLRSVKLGNYFDMSNLLLHDQTYTFLKSFKYNFILLLYEH